MNGGRAASVGGAGRRRGLIAAAAAILLVPVAPGDAGRAAPPLGDSGIVWIAAQPDPFSVGLDPAANQLSRDGSVVGFVTAASAIDPGDIRIDPDAFTYT